MTTEQPKQDTLEELRDAIADEVDDYKSYSHNIIRYALTRIGQYYGRAEAMRAFEDFRLKRRGWTIPE